MTTMTLPSFIDIYFLLDRLQCCCCFACRGHEDETTIVEDNCCRCNYAALSRTLDLGEVEVVYATFHVDVGETPFFVALDYTKRKVRRCHWFSSSIIPSSSSPLPPPPPLPPQGCISLFKEARFIDVRINLR
jgi:hypothetical protein